MDGKSTWRDIDFAERLRKSGKNEVAYLHAYDSVAEVRQRLRRFSSF